MPLTPGTRLGSFEIRSLLGAGGMGEVYRARDSRLGREVALKVLAPKLAEDRDALARFEREARTASGLNHPHVVHIYEIGDAPTPLGTVHYIAMEYVEGETLRARLKAGARWRSLLEPLAQVADALEKAHRAGIVHRDLKPENVMITSEGYPKVVDFGLAKLIETALPTLAQSPESTATFDGRTGAGVIVGTPGYMSPEQVQGKPVDCRSDIFSFGCILYEVTTGRRPFKGSSSVATLHAIVYEEAASIESLAPDVPPELCRVIDRCLAKDPARRHPTMREVGASLRAMARGEATPSPGESPEEARGPARSAGRAWRRWLPTAAALTVAVLIGLAVWRGQRRAVPPVASPGSGALRVEKLTNRGNVRTPAVSPDGRYVVYSTTEESRLRVWRRDIAQKAEMLLVDGIDGEWMFLDFSLASSRDGGSIFYSYARKGGGLVQYAVPLLGGSSRLLGEGGELSPNGERKARTRANEGRWELLVSDADGGSERVLGDSGPYPPLDWTDDSSTLLFTREGDGADSLWIVSAEGTDERKVAALPKGHAQAVWWRPDAKVFLVLVEEKPRVYSLLSFDRDTGAAVPVGDYTWDELAEILWWPDGQAFLAAGWDGNRRRLWSVSYPAGARVLVPDDSSEYSDPSLSQDGRKIVALQSAERSDVLVSARPESGPFKKVAGGTDVLHSLCWTVDGRVVYSGNDSGSYDLYVVGVDGADRKALTFDRSADEGEPAASPDGRYVVFVSNRSGERGLYRVNMDGTGVTSLTKPEAGHGHRNPQFTPDSRWVYYQHWDNGPGVWRVSIDGGAPLLVKGARTGGTKGVEESAFGPGVSPDGKLLAFFYFTKDLATGEFSGMDIAISSLEGQIIKRFPYLESKVVTIGDDMRVQWSRDAATLYYRLLAGGTTNVWRRSSAGGPPVQVTHFAEPDRIQDFDWSFDGKMLAFSRASAVTDAVLITDFR